MVTYYGKINIYYSCKAKIDTKHAEHLKALKNVRLHPFKSGGYGVVRVLKESGKLQNIILSSINNKSLPFLAPFFTVDDARRVVSRIFRIFNAPK